MSSTEKTGVVLINLGTPNAPKAAAVRQFLKQFLKDRRVVNISAWIWYPILYGVILPFRSSKVAKLYQSIWLENGSPLLCYSQQLVDKLKTRFKADNNSIEIALAMTYGAPSIPEVFNKLVVQGCTRFLILPMYPQYSVSTTAAVFDAVSSHLQQLYAPPAITFVDQYYQHPIYINALAESIRKQWQEVGKGEILLFSFHGTPERFKELGDPYSIQCEKTAQKVAEKLELTENE